MNLIFLYLLGWASPWSQTPNEVTPWGPYRSPERQEARENFFEEISRTREPRESDFSSTTLSKIRSEDLAPVGDMSGDDDLVGAKELSKLPWANYEPSAREVGSRPGRFIWPVAGGKISSGFGPRGGGFHEGLDIKARGGSPIRAVAAGKVVFSGHLNGYGKTLVIAHGGGLATVYAHNEQNLMEVGDRVRQGSTIAFVGSSGKATGSHLHFEVRLKGKPQNPLSHSFDRIPLATASR